MPPKALELFKHAELQSVELAAGWFNNLQQTVFNSDHELGYYVSAHTDSPSVILAVRVVYSGLVCRLEALGNFYTSLFSPVLAPDATVGDLAALLQSASSDHSGAHEMRFAPMDPASTAYTLTLTALRSIGWLPFMYYCFGNWYLPVETDWKTYLATRNGEVRSTIKRKGKKFAAAGGTLQIVTTSEGAEDAIAAFNHVYALSWKKPEPYPDFIPGLVRWLAQRGWLRMGIARLQGQPIAAQLWMVSHGRANIFKLAYDEQFSEFASGTLLTAHLMEHVMDTDRVKEVDYLIGDDPYKQLWMTQRRERWGIVATSPRTLIGLALTAREVGSRLLRLLRGRCGRRGG